jgi:hypothetical protein
MLKVHIPAELKLVRRDEIGIVKSPNLWAV